MQLFSVLWRQSEDRLSATDLTDERKIKEHKASIKIRCRLRQSKSSQVVLIQSIISSENISTGSYAGSTHGNGKHMADILLDDHIKIHAQNPVCIIWDPIQPQQFIVDLLRKLVSHREILHAIHSHFHRHQVFIRPAGNKSHQILNILRCKILVKKVKTDLIKISLKKWKPHTFQRVQVFTVDYSHKRSYGCHDPFLQ